MEQIGPASLDFRLGKTFKYYRKDNLTLIDTRTTDYINHLHQVEYDENTPFILHP
jgi:deoxycytidine triphosphate deaminase